MANEIVKYHSDMNTVSLRNFNSIELNIFMAIVSRVRDKGENVIEYDFHYLKQLIGLDKVKGKDTRDFAKMLDSTYNKLIQCNIRIGNDVKWTRFVLFTQYEIDTIEQKITITVNKKFIYVINDLITNFTRYDLSHYVSFKSTYTKEFYRRMKQFNTGLWKVDIEEFKRLLDIPSKYRTGDIDIYVLSHITRELYDYNVSVEKVYNKPNGKGGRPKLKGYIFRFDVKDTYITVKKDIEVNHILDNYVSCYISYINKKGKITTYRFIDYSYFGNNFYLRLRHEGQDTMFNFNSLDNALEFLEKYKLY